MYHRCTGFKGRGGNTYVRQEQLAELLGTTVQAIQIPPDIADDIASALRDSDSHAARERGEAQHRLEVRRRAVLGKLDRAYEDYVSGRISEEFWTRKSEQWEARTAPSARNDTFELHVRSRKSLSHLR